MKRKILISCLIMLLLVVVTGCGSKKEENKGNKSKQESMICTINKDVSSGVKLLTEYKIVYTGKNVDQLDTTEKIISDDKSILNTYKTTVESMYEPYKDLEYYDYKVTVEDNTLTSSVKIDYSKIDTDKLISINADNKQLITDGKVKVETVKNIYEQMGATCK